MPAKRHGSRQLERLLKSNQLDRRTGTARTFHALQDALAEDRGGWAHCTAAEKLLIERCAAEALICRSIEAWSFRQVGGVVQPSGELLAPLFKGYCTHAANLQRMLATLGLRPDKIERLPDLADFLQQQGEDAPA